MADTGICARPPQVFPDPDALAAAAARRWSELCCAAQSTRGLFHVALAGGSTPKRLYQVLATAGAPIAVDWTRVHLYFGDERAVPPDHADSNYRMVREALVERIHIPAAHVHRMQATPENIARDADDYAALLGQRLPTDAAGMPVFDLILLGMGADGHTCSLFPDTPILDERRRAVAAVHVPRLESWRLSLTYPVLDAARQLLFLVTGEDKAHRLRHVCHDAAPPVPVQRIRPRGSVDWFIDRAAAQELDP